MSTPHFTHVKYFVIGTNIKLISNCLILSFNIKLGQKYLPLNTISQTSTVI